MNRDLGGLFFRDPWPLGSHSPALCSLYSGPPTGQSGLTAKHISDKGEGIEVYQKLAHMTPPTISDMARKAWLSPFYT